MPIDPREQPVSLYRPLALVVLMAESPVYSTISFPPIFAKPAVASPSGSPAVLGVSPSTSVNQSGISVAAAPM